MPSNKSTNDCGDHSVGYTRSVGRLRQRSQRKPTKASPKPVLPLWEAPVAAASVFERYGPAIRHYWCPVVLIAGLIAGLAIWCIRRRRGVNLPVKRQRS